MPQRREQFISIAFRIDKRILKNKKESWSTYAIWFLEYAEATVIKTVWHQHKDQDTEISGLELRIHSEALCLRSIAF